MSLYVCPKKRLEEVPLREVLQFRGFPMELRDRVGQRLRRLRLCRHHSLQAVAADLGIGLSALSSYELGQRSLSLERLARLAEYYGLTPAELLQVDDPRLDGSGSQDDQRPGARVDRP